MDLKRERSESFEEENKNKKRRKFKYQYTPEMKNQPVPIHYIYDRLATDEQINKLLNRLEYRKNIYSNLTTEQRFILRIATQEEKDNFYQYIDSLIEMDLDISYIIYEMDDYIEDCIT